MYQYSFKYERKLYRLYVQEQDNTGNIKRPTSTNKV